MSSSADGVDSSDLFFPFSQRQAIESRTMNTPQQGELSFDGNSGEVGYSKWMTMRTVAAAELARRVGLPLGHKVEVWLTNGVCLRGVLRLREEVLLVEEESARHLALRVDRADFTYREIESCVRLD